MQRSWIVIAAAMLAAWPASVAAQRPRQPPRPPGVFVLHDDNRGRIGVVVKTQPDSEADKVGAKIEGVTPGGPAAKAGLKVGDIIIRFNGTALAGLKAEDEDESGPGTKLVQLAHKLEPGDTVQIEYRRGSDTKKAMLVAEDLGWMPNVRVMPGMPGMPGMPDMPDMRHFEFSFGSPWGDLELVSLNADLGEYFGTKDGVLVVKAPADSSLPLKGGDVITSIGGRKPANPSHAMRILHSYEKGETVSIEILRKQKRMTVAGKIPAREDRIMHMHQEHEEHEDHSGLRRLLREQGRDAENALRRFEVQVRRLRHLQQV